MTTKYGDFIAPKFLSEGDAYVDKERKDERNKGLNFKVPVSRSGKNNDATFSKYLASSVGDRYLDPLKLEAEQTKMAKVGKPITDLPFKAPSPIKHGFKQAGDSYGTFGGKIEYMMGAHTETKLKKGDVKAKGRQILTNPMKLGGYGFNKTTLSERKGYKGAVGEYEYIADPFDKPQPSLGQAVASTPFRPPRIHSLSRTFGKYEHIPLGAPIPLKTYGKTVEVASPFKPPSGGTSDSIARYPEHMPCPPLEPASKVKKVKEGNAPAWRPNRGYLTRETPSILRMNI